MHEIRTAQPSWNTGVLRYDFQIACARLADPGVVLNVGCNEDPSGLRQRYGSRVVNCDREGYDEHMKRPNVVDRIFDALKFPWPFADDSAELVVFGDILEHFPVAQSIEALKEARRIANSVCVTVPEDTRIDEAAELAKWKPGVYNLHTTIITEDVIKGLLGDAGWELDWLVTGVWGIGGDWGPEGINGWCARGHREQFTRGGVVDVEASRLLRREIAEAGTEQLVAA